MPQKTSISWTDMSSSLIRVVRKDNDKWGWGCVKVSPGCVHCYAETMNKRFGTGLPFNVQSLERVEFSFNEKEATKVSKLKTRNKIFICDMTDVFGEFIPFEMAARIWDLMFSSPTQTFQVLTKRPERMVEFMNMFTEDRGIDDSEEPLITFDSDNVRRYLCAPDQWPLSNVWLGTSVENQKQTARVEYLVKTPASVRFLSVEPLLEPIELPDLTGIHWLIVGGESGRGARQCELQWIRNIVQQGKEAGVACFVKQLGTDLAKRLHLKDYKGADMAEWPDDLKLQELPQ